MEGELRVPWMDGREGGRLVTWEWDSWSLGGEHNAIEAAALIRPEIDATFGTFILRLIAGREIKKFFWEFIFLPDLYCYFETPNKQCAFQTSQDFLWIHPGAKDNIFPLLTFLKLIQNCRRKKRRRIHLKCSHVQQTAVSFCTKQNSPPVQERQWFEVIDLSDREIRLGDRKSVV